MTLLTNIGISLLLLQLILFAKSKQIKATDAPSSPPSTTDIPPIVTAQWSSDFLSIIIDITDKNDGTYTLSNECSTILDDTSISSIGTDASCIWTNIQQEQLQLTLYVSSTATIALEDTLTLIIWNYRISSIALPSNPSAPLIVLSSTSNTITCDDLILDARSTTNLGGRDGTFSWIITNIDDRKDTMTYSGSYNVVENTLFKSGKVYTIVLTVTNWYERSSNTEYTVYKTDNIPSVSLYGVTQYSSTDGNLQIDSDIILHDNCTGETASDATDEWITSIKWSMHMQKIDSNDPVKKNVTAFKALKFHLKDVDTDGVSIPPSYLQSGFVYEFEMNVKCVDTCDIDAVHTVVYYHTIHITATAITSSINRNDFDSWRVIADITDDDDDDDIVYEYEWQEINGLLSEDILAEYQQINLILDSNILNQGETYVFQLQITAKYSEDGAVVGFGESNTIYVYVIQSPVIESFIVNPICTAQYESISELLSSSHLISIAAEGDNEPFLYQFGVRIDENDHYVHDSLLSEGLLNDIYLPAMDSFILFGNVYDVEGSVGWTEMECSITLNSYSECIDIEASLQSGEDSYMLQQIQVYVQYLEEYYDGQDTDCVQQQIVNILNMMHEVFEADLESICDEQKVIELTQSMISLLSLMDAHNTEEMYTDDMLNKIEDLVFIVLDPCSYIMTEIDDLNDLSVSDESVITQIPCIYHNNNDISQHLSSIISQPNYQHLLFEIASSIITFIHSMSYSDAMAIYDLLSSSIYIAQMIDISVSISGESDFQSFDSFSIYSERVIPGESVDVEIQNVMVHIPNDITVSSSDAVDAYVFISGIEISDSDRNVAVDISDDDAVSEGILFGNVLIDITLLSDSVDSSNLPSNIEFIVSCNDNENEACDDTVHCVWYNKEDNIWQNDGCSTSIDSIEEEIICSCEHLTTFAIIYNMHQTELTDTETSVFIDNKSSELEIYAHWILSGIFLMISAYVLFQIYPFFTHKDLEWKHRAVFVMLMVAITSFLYFLICLEYLIVSSVSIKLMTLLLLLPHVSYLLIFSMLFYTWFTLAHSFNPNIHNMRRTLHYYLCGLNIGISCLLLIYFILIMCDIGGYQIFKIASFVWSGLTTLITIIITIYAIISGKVLYETTKNSVSKQSFAAKDWKMVRRLITINACITLYFMFETFITIYYAIRIDNTKNIMSHKLLELVVNVFCLICICCMYRQSMKRLIKSNLYHAKRREKDVAARRKTVTNMDLPSKASAQDLPHISPGFMNKLSVDSLTQSKSPPSSARTSQCSTGALNLAPIVEKEEPKSIRVEVEGNDNDVRNSAVIPSIIEPEISIRSREIDASSILEDIKNKERNSFQFYYNLRAQLNTMIHGAADDANEINDNMQHTGHDDRDETETAMYAYVSSSRRSIR